MGHKIPNVANKNLNKINNINKKKNLILIQNQYHRQ